MSFLAASTQLKGQQDASLLPGTPRIPLRASRAIIGNKKVAVSYNGRLSSFYCRHDAPTGVGLYSLGTLDASRREKDMSGSTV